MDLVKNTTIRRKKTSVHVLQEADVLEVREMCCGNICERWGRAGAGGTRTGARKRGLPGRTRDWPRPRWERLRGWHAPQSPGPLCRRMACISAPG